MLGKAMQDLPRGTVTFLFTDVVGNTRLGRLYPTAMEADLRRHEEIVALAVRSHGGTLFKWVGDESQAAFARPIDAVNAAVDAQLALKRERWQVPESDPFRVRMAIDLCVADPRKDDQGNLDYRTPNLNPLGRLRGAGHGGQILVSSVVEDLVRDELREKGAALENLGEYRLEDLEPERLFQVVHPDLESVFPPLRSAARFTHNLPYLPTPLIGRERETADVREMLREDRVRLATLTGPGGTGKTRLAIHVAAGLLDAFADGVFLVDLAALSDPEVVPSVIARTLGVREEPERPIVASVAEWLRDRQVLLVLDTFEQVVGAAAIVAELLGACPRLKILVASRVALSIQAEHVYPVPSLAVPDESGPAEVVIASESVRLFVERARSLQPDFAANATSAPSLARICARLDGLPLAIELAAARIKVFPPQVLAARLERRLPFLTGGPRDLPARQRTLRDTIAWSYDLLGPAEQSLFRRLSVFAGGFSFESAVAVAGSDELRASGFELAAEGPIDDAGRVVDRSGFDARRSTLEPLDGIQVLIDHSLLRQEHRDGEPRYAILDTIREFGWDRLDADGELAIAQDRHAAVFLDLAQRTEPHLRGAERERQLASLDREQDNLRAALGWLRDRGDAERGLRLASALWQWWWWRTSLVEGRRWLEEMLALPDAHHYPRLRARALTGLATLVETQGEHEASDELFAQAEELWQKEGDPHGLATSLLFRWLVAFDNEDYRRMNELAQLSHETFESVGDTWGVALSETELGISAMREGRLGEAEAHLTSSLTRFGSIQDRWGVAVATGTLGNVEFGKAAAAAGSGDVAAAMALHGLGMTRLKESFDLFLQMDDGWGLATFMLAPARAASDLRQWERAARLMGAAVAFSDAIGAPVRLPFRELFNANKAKAQNNLGEEAFARAWAEGQAMSPKQAIEYAFSV
jgi:predicted ATPase/class 3 adenylate cyclase